MPSQATLDRFQDERDAAARPELREGFKADAGKNSFTYLPFDALGAINKVLIFGAKKYADRNWEKGMNWTRPWDACIRHLEAWMRREEGDPETGMSHLWHAGCCILFLIAYELRGVGTDDRPAALTTEPVRIAA
ncbi:dATP/dGTP diphosphohydrolase domain-containing protein [Bradyrhizobium cenepequi]